MRSSRTPQQRAEPGQPRRGVLHVGADLGLVDVVVADGLEDDALLGIEQADVDVVVAKLQARFRHGVLAEQRVVPPVHELAADEIAALLLLELIAGVGAQLVVGEVRPELQGVVLRIGRRVGVARGVVLVPFAGDERPAAVATVARVERREAAELSGGDECQRHLVGGGPVRGVADGIRRPSLGIGAVADTHESVVLAHAFGRRPRAVVGLEFERAEHARAGGGGVWRGAEMGQRGERGRARQHHSAVAFAAGREVQDALIEGVPVLDVRRAGGREVAVLGKVRALAVLDLVDQLGDQEIQVGVALAVRVAGHVGRHAVDERGEVGAVVEVVAAQEILVRLAIARVLGDDHAGHGLQHFAGPQQRQVGQPFAPHRALRRGVGRPDAVLVVRRDLDLLRAGLGLGSGVAR